MSDNKLVLPGSLPGLLRKGSPCADNEWGDGVLVAVGEGLAAVGHGGGISMVVDDIPLEDLTLDLTDATGRAHAAWWLADQVMADDDSRRQGVFWWAPPPSEFHGRQIPGQLRWMLGARFSGIHARFFVGDESMVRMVGRSGFHPDEDPEGSMPDPDWSYLPELGALELDDERLLDDGSRWLDAEALRLVCLHVAGLEDAVKGLRLGL